MERDGRQRMENEMLKVWFIETSGVKDLGGCDHLKASDGREKKTEKLWEHSVRSVIHKATGITKIIEIEKKTEPRAKIFKEWTEGPSGR